MQVTAATGMHCPFWQALPAPQVGLHASGTQEPSTQTFPAPQKSAQVFEEVEHAASPVRSSAARRVVVRFKVRSLSRSAFPRPLAAAVGDPSKSTVRTNGMGQIAHPGSGLESGEWGRCPMRRRATPFTVNGSRET